MTTMRSMPGVLVLLAAACAAQAAGEAHHWGYNGAHGPAAWGEEHGAEAWGVGKQQSPIDIRGAKSAALPALAFGYRKSAGEVVNNGHTIQVNLADGGTLDIG